MVYYFTSNVDEAPAIIYVGKDKFENEELIKYGWDEDFHADNLSSAHVYLRLKPGQEWDKLPTELVEDCAQLTKANSIEVLVPTRLNPTINRLMKTRTVASADGLFADKEQHLSELRAKAREKAKEARKEEERLKRERTDQKYKREHAYEDLMKGDDDVEGGGKRSNQEGWDEDDFM
ncbi:MAG: hypothetical protein Q9219_001968 [cf. Caloplaca sp. 3 TL-2023]